MVVGEERRRKNAYSKFFYLRSFGNLGFTPPRHKTSKAGASGRREIEKRSVVNVNNCLSWIVEQVSYGIKFLIIFFWAYLGSFHKICAGDQGSLFWVVYDKMYLTGVVDVSFGKSPPLLQIRTVALTPLPPFPTRAT